MFDNKRFGSKNWSFEASNEGCKKTWIFLTRIWTSFYFLYKRVHHLLKLGWPLPSLTFKIVVQFKIILMISKNVVYIRTWGDGTIVWSNENLSEEEQAHQIITPTFKHREHPTTTDEDLYQLLHSGLYSSHLSLTASYTLYTWSNQSEWTMLTIKCIKHVINLLKIRPQKLKLKLNQKPCSVTCSR